MKVCSQDVTVAFNNITSVIRLTVLQRLEIDVDILSDEIPDVNACYTRE